MIDKIHDGFDHWCSSNGTWSSMCRTCKTTIATTDKEVSLAIVDYHHRCNGISHTDLILSVLTWLKRFDPDSSQVVGEVKREPKTPEKE